MPSTETALSEQDLIKACIRNDRRAQKRLYEQYCASLLAVARAYTCNEEEATEVLHNSFLSIFQQLDHFDTGRSLYLWMRTNVVHTATDRICSRNHAPQLFERNDAPETPIAAEMIHGMSAQQIMH